MVYTPTAQIVERVEARLWRHIIGHAEECKCMACFYRYQNEMMAKPDPVEWVG